MVTRVKQRGIRVTTKNRDREQSGVLSPEILNGGGGSVKRTKSTRSKQYFSDIYPILTCVCAVEGREMLMLCHFYSCLKSTNINFSTTNKRLQSCF